MEKRKKVIGWQIETFLNKGVQRHGCLVIAELALMVKLVPTGGTIGLQTVQCYRR